MHPRLFQSVFSLCLAALATLLGGELRAQMATEPLLTRSTAVHPNLVFIYDDSGSMNANYIYQYGGSPSGMGMSGPPQQGSVNEAAQSPNINRIYYDPRIRYKNRVDASGNDIRANTLRNGTDFEVYFYKSSSSATQTSTWNNTGNNPSNGSTSFFKSGSPNGYQPLPIELAPGASTTTPYPNKVSNNIKSYPKWLARTDCISSFAVCTWQEELQNFSVWSAYHSTREEIAKTGVGLAFKDIGPTVRLGWATINRLEFGQLTSGVALFDASVKAQFYNWLYNIPIYGDTPNRKALDTVGKYFSRIDSAGPWGSNPNPSSTGTSASGSNSGAGNEPTTAHMSCRRSFTMLMTDGYYNDRFSSVGNMDGSTGPTITTPSGSTYQYKPARPYADSYTNTLADVALKYWATDLRPDLANNVPASPFNESFWQNMSFYAIGLGIWGTLEPNATNLSRLKAGTLSWPSPDTDDPTAIDDMWHATLNARGSMLTATDSQSLNDSIDNMMANIRQITNTQSGVAVSTASLNVDTRKYTPQYTTGSWSGNITAYELDDAGNQGSIAWQVVGKDASGKLISGIPAHGSRNLVVGTGAAPTSSSSRSVNFTLSAMNSAGVLNDLPATARNADMVNFLRGDQSKEGDAGGFRERITVLGDMVNSTPIMIKGAPFREASDAKSASSPVALEVLNSSNPLPGTGSAYSAYRSALASRSEGVLWVGGNDGILHAFRDGSAGVAGGQEIFGFVPRSVLPKMSSLADRFYTHQYLVDGPQTETDAFISGSWKQLLLGSTGAGAKSLYALNVTEPLRGGTSNLGTDTVLWEVSPNTSGYANLGYVLSEIQAGPTNGVDTTANPSLWAGFLGNGYESASGTASMFVVNLANGELIRELQTPSATGGPWSVISNGVTTTTKNGLGGVKLVLDASAQRVLGAYAGDLRGNVWRFDLSNKDPSKWPVPELLFSTGTSKPITAAPEVVNHPISGRMVVVGTGKFFETKDLDAPYGNQSLLGLWDKTAFGTPLSTQAGAYPIATNKLDTRVLVNGDLTSATGGELKVIDWSNKLGWTLDLPNAGERVVFPLRKLGFRNSRVLYAATLSPANVSQDPCIQTGSGTQWEIWIDGLYGANPSKAPDIVKANWASIFGTNSGGTTNTGANTSAKMVSEIGAQGISSALMVVSPKNSTGNSGTVSGAASGAGSGSNTTQNFVLISAGSSASNSLKINCALAGCSTATITSREWRQLYMR